MNKMPAMMAVLLIVDSLHFVFARLLLPYLPPVTSSFFYMTVALLEIALIAVVRREINWRVFRDNARFFLIIGFLVALATSTSYAAVEYIDPGTAAMISRMNTVFAMGFAVLWLKERLSRGETFGALIAVVGVFIISFQLDATNPLLWLGTTLVLISSFSYALHSAIVKQGGGEIDFTNFFLFRMVTTCSFLLIFALARGEMVWPSGRDVWVLLLVTATLNVTISRSLYYIVLRRVNLSILTILLTLSPVLTIVWSLALFGARPTLQGLLGGLAVIAGVLIVTTSRRNASVLV